MLSECLEGLNISPDGIYVDVTFGGGGHSRAIVEALSEGKLYAFDQDQDAFKNAEALDQNRFKLIKSNFRHLKKQLRFAGVKQVDGLLADLGVSSHQFDEGTRGFSTRFDGPLDMRMDQHGKVKASDIVNNYDADQLQKIFGIYGEVKNARTLAQHIVQGRKNLEIETIEQFKDLIKNLVPNRKQNQYYAQVFQALRIEVNEEMKALEEMLEQCTEVIKPGGRLVVMSYHSLEDRMVKNYIKTGKMYGEPEKDFYGNVIKPFDSVTRKPVVAGEEELKENNRARSAKLRIAEKK